jgi:transcriptional regulator of acetoin/glycerol metabolism
MTPSQVVTVMACVSQLALALLCVVRAARSPLAVPLAILCLDIFGWSGAGLAYELSGRMPWTLDRVHGNRSLAARILGVSRRTLYNKLAEHGLA